MKALLWAGLLAFGLVVLFDALERNETDQSTDPLANSPPVTVPADWQEQPLCSFCGCEKCTWLRDNNVTIQPIPQTWRPEPWDLEYPTELDLEHGSDWPRVSQT